MKSILLYYSMDDLDENDAGDTVGELKVFGKIKKNSKRNLIKALMQQARTTRRERLSEQESIVKIKAALGKENNASKISDIIQGLGFLSGYKKVFVDYISKFENKEEISKEMIYVLSDLNNTSDDDLFALLSPIYKFKLDCMKAAMKLSGQTNTEYLEQIIVFEKAFEEASPELFDAIDIFINDTLKGGKRRKRKTKKNGFRKLVSRR